jgi:aldehyde:ferredoxin oxidoreductase
MTMDKGNSGGIWGSELKWAGFDALVITGRAEKPYYLFLQDGKIEGDIFPNRYNIGRSACGNCPLPCWQKYLVKEGRFQGAWTDAIENSTVQCFGTKIANSDPEGILIAHTLCDKHGLDEISVGVTIAFAMECFQKKIITEKDTDGPDLSWGNVDTLSN